MAEFCLDCWNQINHRRDTERNWVLSKEPDLCEGCGQWRRVIVAPRIHRLLYDLHHRKKQWQQ